MHISRGGKIISSILKHDSKQTSYKIALVRAINDIVLSYADVHGDGADVAVPLRLLAEFWLAYYYPFVDPAQPIYQGARAVRNGRLASDIVFRDDLAEFRRQWQQHFGSSSNPADGFYAINELRLPRSQTEYPTTLFYTYRTALKSLAHAIEKPIQYAGPKGQVWSVFEKPKPYEQISARVVAVPGTQSRDLCLIVSGELWQAFRELSLWIEALCIHEWCLFTDGVTQDVGVNVDRGTVYCLLTARPANRRPLTWERNQVDVLLLEGHEFRCPWTEKAIRKGTAYDLDHLLPIAVYPINELWNLVPSDPQFNSHHKRDRLPSTASLQKAEPYLTHAYDLYTSSLNLQLVLREDVALRFAQVNGNTSDFPQRVTAAVTGFIREIAQARNLAEF